MRCAAFILALVLAAPCASAKPAASEPFSSRAFAERRFEDALAEAKARLEREPRNPDALLTAGMALLELGRADDAEPLLERAWRVDPKRAAAARAVGMIYVERGESAFAGARVADALEAWTAAERWFQKAARASPGWPPAIEGLVAARLRRTTAGADDAPSKAGEAYERLVRELADSERWPDLVAMAELALREESGRPLARRIARELLENARYREARPFVMGFATSGNPGDVWATVASAFVDPPDRAFEMFRDFLASGPDAGSAALAKRAVSDLLLARSLGTARPTLADWSRAKPPVSDPDSASAVLPSPGTDGVTLPRLIKKVDPEISPGRYPRGAVVLECLILEDGSVVPLRIPAVDNKAVVKTAVDAVRRWRYEPARQDGEPIAVVYSVVVKFR